MEMETTKLIEAAKGLGFDLSNDDALKLIEKLHEPSKLDERVLKRVLVAKGLSTREAAKVLNVDSSEIQTNMIAKTSLGDSPGQQGWSAKRLRTSKYAEITYSQDEFDQLKGKFPGLSECHDILVDVEHLDNAA